MTPRERLLRALDGEPVDRTPVWLLFPYHPTAYYVDVRAHAAYRRVCDVAEAHGVIVLNRRNPGVRLHTDAVLEQETTAQTAAGPVRRRSLRYGGASLTSDTPLAPGGGARGKKLLRSDEDLELFCSLPIEQDPRRIEAALEPQLAAYRRERDAFPLDQGAMMLDLGSPVNALYHAADLESYAIWSLTHPQLIVAWLDRVMAQLEQVYRFFLERDLADVYFLVGSELAAPPLVSPATFRRWVVPYERALIDLIHAYGKRVIQHYHGHIRALLPDFQAMGADGLHTIEAPPVGNCTLSQAYATTGERITLIGNIQYDEFRSATPAAMRRRVAETLDEVAGRRFILSPTAGPFDAAPSATLIENYLAFIAAASAYPAR